MTMRPGLRPCLAAALLLTACADPPAATTPAPASPASTSAPAIPMIAAAADGPPLRCADGVPPQAYVWAVDGTLFELDVANLATRGLGIPACPTPARPWALSVSQRSTAYLMYDDWSIYALDLASFKCAATAYSPNALGFLGTASLALGAERSEDRLYVYGVSTAPQLAVSDVSDYTPFVLGPVGQTPPEPFLDLKTDAYGRLFGLAPDGVLSQLDPATGAVLAQDQLELDPASTAVLLTYGTDLFVIGGESGVVSRYDLDTKAFVPVFGLLHQTIVGASAPSCTVKAPIFPAATANGPPSFSSGDVWIGTYECPQETMNVALVVESFDGAALVARLDFDWLAEHTTGSYEMSGTFDPNTREAKLGAGNWVSQPSADWTTVNLDGFVTLDGLEYSGAVKALGCGSFTLRR
jgi:hypothetical protein